MIFCAKPFVYLKSISTYTSFLHRYAIRESNSVVKIFKNFKDKKSFKPDFGAEGNYYHRLESPF